MAEPTVMSDELLVQAYCDGELSGPERTTFEARLAAESNLAAMVEANERVGLALRSFDSVLDAPVPVTMVSALRRRRGPHRVWAAAAAAFLTGLAVGLAVTASWETEEPVATNLRRPLPAEATLAHAVYSRERRHAVEVKADELAHLNAWLSKRLTHEVVAPQLQTLGYNLMGGRLLADAGQPAAQFMYESVKKERFTLFVRAHGQAAQTTQTTYFESDGLGVLHWMDGQLAYAWTGPPGRDALEALATQTRGGVQR